MPSPFPGMDPYLEARWGSLHVLLIAAVTAALNRSLPAGLEARPEEDVRVETLAGERLHGHRGDVGVADLGTREPTGGPSAAAVAESVRIAYRRAPVVLRDIRIVDARDDARDGDRVVTRVELLSPYNKLAGRLNRDYRRKLRDAEGAGANWVEVDLLRSSRDRLPVTWADLPPERRADYLIVTFRAAEEQVTAYPVSVRRRLPTVPVPLREGEADVPLDVQAAFDRAYAEGPFGSLDYGRPATPPLSAADAAWAAGLTGR